MLTANRSNVGRIRQVNEDSAWAGQLPGGAVLAIVADGMGGHQAGDVASQVAVDAFLASFEQAAEKEELSEDEGKMLIRQAIANANEQVFAMAASDERYHNMGTTIVAALFHNGSVVLGHVGDSRAYSFSGDSIELLTADHSLVNELLKSGQLSEEEAANHPRRNVITRAVGTDAQVEVDVKSIPWNPDNVLLLCSDGLTDMVSEEALLAAISSDLPDLEAKADHLIQLALDAGGEDNVTVVLLQEEGAAKREERRL